MQLGISCQEVVERGTSRYIVTSPSAEIVSIDRTIVRSPKRYGRDVSKRIGCQTEARPRGTISGEIRTGIDCESQSVYVSPCLTYDSRATIVGE